jgi:hypothetical protein
MESNLICSLVLGGRNFVIGPAGPLLLYYGYGVKEYSGWWLAYFVLVGAYRRGLTYVQAYGSSNSLCFQCWSERPTH